MSTSSPQKSSTPDPTDSLLAPEIFPPEEEASLLKESHSEKTTANTYFTQGDYSSAIQGYNKALALCPTYLDYDIAVLKSNISACHIKLAEWKEAVDAATEALDGLDRLDPPLVTKKTEDEGADGRNKEGEEGKVEEVDDAAEVRLEALTRTQKTVTDVRKLRIKVLLRRAKSRREVGGWSSLQGAHEDYSRLSTTPTDLSSLDQKTVQAALREIPPQLEGAKQKEMAEMMGKLKQLGNGILKPFGLSTDNFNFVKDEGSGGYNMQFNR